MTPTSSAVADFARPRFFWRQIGDALFVVDLDAFEFTILNGSAAVIWLSLLDQPHRAEALAAMLAEAFGQPQARIRDDIAALLETWGRLGWLEGDSSDGWCIPSQSLQAPPLPYQPVPAERLADATGAAFLEWQHDMDFAGQAVTVRFYCEAALRDSDASMRARTFLSGLPPAPAASRRPINCYMTQAGLFVNLEGNSVAARDVSDGLSRLVLWCFYLGYGSDGFLGTFHAAALGRPEGAILLPGLSGAGKSTLTAYLAAQGWSYGGDDIVGLSRADAGTRNLVLPFCSAISVKEGSEDLLTRFYPELADLPQLRYDTKLAKFLCIPPQRQMGAQAAPRRIGAIVFPQYRPSGGNRLTELTTKDALLALVGVGYRTGELMDADLLAGMFDFLDGTPKYRFDYSDITRADADLRGLL